VWPFACAAAKGHSLLLLAGSWQALVLAQQLLVDCDGHAGNELKHLHGRCGNKIQQPVKHEHCTWVVALVR
jgi:hypothetical protein